MNQRGWDERDEKRSRKGIAPREVSVIRSFDNLYMFRRVEGKVWCAIDIRSST